MTPQQQMDVLRQVLQAAGAVALMFGVASDVVAGWTATILSLAGPGLMVISLIWGMVANRQSAVVTAVANMPEVKAVQLNAAVPGTPALSAATPENVRIG